MTDIQLIYASKPFGFDDLVLRGILATARRNNERDGITGALVCREDLFLQLLEGPGDAVLSAFGRICRDDRHIDVNKLAENPIASRLFPEWSMRHDPAQSWMWSREEVANGAVTRASPVEILGVFSRLAAMSPAPDTCGRPHQT